MKTSVRLSLAILTVGLPMLALAAPGGVTGMTAVVQPDGVMVGWHTVEGGDIASYRIFYSHASILSNNGLYDDFEEVSATETTHLLRNIPASGELYVSVLAVDKSGAESPYFLEEAHVKLSDAPMGGTAMPEPPAPQAMRGEPVEDVLRLLSVEAVSATGVVLRFSHEVTMDPSLAPTAIVIETGSGVKLAMKRLTVRGTDILVDTAMQERGAVYRVTVTAAISASGSSGQRLAVLPDQEAMLFMGHPTGSASPAASTGKSEAMQLRLRAQPTGAVYRVEATWQPASGPVKGYSVAQTSDNGRTYGQAHLVSAENRDVVIPNVPAGNFGILLKTVSIDGSTSRGVLQTITLPKTGAPVAGAVTGGSTALPNSGPALWVAISMAVAVAAYMQTHRKKMATQVA